MRRGVWVVLGLMGMAPVGALAQQAQGQPARQDASASGRAGQRGTAAADSAPSVIIEMPARGGRIANTRASESSGALRCWMAAGGSGRSASPPAQAAAPGDEIFVGTVRAVTADRLLMAGPSGRVYEFGLGRQTRVIGPTGAAVSIQAVREGAQVRTVTRESGGFENRVVSLQLFRPAPAPTR